MTTTEPTVQWSQDQMVEVLLNEPDDFLKVRETLTRIGVASEKKRNYTKVVIYYTSKVSITSFTSRNCLLLMANMLTLLLMMCSVGIVSPVFFLIGDLSL